MTGKSHDNTQEQPKPRQIKVEKTSLKGQKNSLETETVFKLLRTECHV